MDYILSNVWLASIVVFVSQVMYIYLRTLNIMHTSNMNIKDSMTTSIGLSVTWLVAMSIGVNSALTGSIPPIIAFLLGNALGTYWGMIYGKRKHDK